jgi:hypothetical protein
LQSAVSDLKTNATNGLSTQEKQKHVTKMVESPLAIHYKGVTVTLGGFLAAESACRQHGTASDVLLRSKLFSLQSHRRTIHSRKCALFIRRCANTAD